MRPAVFALILVGTAGCSQGTPPAAPSGSAGPGAATPAPPAVHGGLVLSGPFVHENLALYVAEDPKAESLGELITLEEGLKSGAVRVTEKEQAEVSELLIENSSGKPCFVQAGDVVKGGQQDRVIAADFVIPPGSKPTPLSSFCVEQGRWHGGARFAMAELAAPTPALKVAVRGERDQDRVWQEVHQYKRNLVAAQGLRPSRSSSLNEEAEDKTVQERREAFRKALGGVCEGKPRAVGIVTAVNGRISTADLYGDPGLFRKLFPRLLDAAALEAIAAPKEDSPWPATADVASFLENAGKGPSREETPRGGLRARTVENERTLLFESRWNDRVLHRQSLNR